MKMSLISAVPHKRRAERSSFLVPAGQHYDEAMSGLCFRDLGLPAPDSYLDARGGAHAEQTARTLLTGELVLLPYQTNWMVAGCERHAPARWSSANSVSWPHPSNLCGTVSTAPYQKRSIAY